MQEDTTNLHLRDSHQKEWESSKVHPEIIFNNVRSVSGNNAYERLLYALDTTDRRNDGRLRDRFLRDYGHLDHGGWWCNGLDLTTFSAEALVNQNYAQESEWGCFKPDRPRIHAGKPIKYEHPPKAPAGIFALEIGPELFGEFQEKYDHLPTDEPPIPVPVGVEFWRWVLDNREIPVCITEGAKKAGCLLSHGHAAIGLAGVWNFADDDGALKPEIKALCSSGREFTIVFDQDNRWHVRDKVARAARRLAELLEAEGCQVTILLWKYEEGKGIDDFVAKQKQGELEELFEKRLYFSEYWEKHVSPREMKRPQFLKFLQTELKGKFAFNQLSGRVEWDGKPIELSGELSYRFLEEFNIDAHEKVITDGLLHVARQNAYHPVRRYLDSIAHLPPANIDRLAEEHFGADDPFYNVLVKKWLVGAVARIYEPGCQFDNALILQGDAYAGKSTWFATMGGDWFSDSFGSEVRASKELMKLHCAWIHEWSEFDNIASKQQFQALKSFLSSKSDDFVRPYGREVTPNPRMSVMGGSINPQAFLQDETGDRKFWVIPVQPGFKIPIEQVRADRDRIWAAAVQLYRENPNIRYTTPEEHAYHQKINERFRDYDPWHDQILNFLIEKRAKRISIDRILIECLFFSPDRIDTKVRNRVRRTLTSLGAISIGSRFETEYDGKARRLWEVPDTIFPTEPETSVPSLPLSEDEPRRSTTVDRDGYNGSTTVNKCTPLYAETETGQSIQESRDGYNAPEAEKLFQVSEKEPPDIPAAIDPRPRCVVDRVDGECRVVCPVNFAGGGTGYEIETPQGERKRVSGWIVTILDDESEGGNGKN